MPHKRSVKDTLPTLEDPKSSTTCIFIRRDPKFYEISWSQISLKSWSRTRKLAEAANPVSYILCRIGWPEKQSKSNITQSKCLCTRIHQLPTFKMRFIRHKSSFSLPDWSFTPSTRLNHSFGVLLDAGNKVVERGAPVVRYKPGFTEQWSKMGSRQCLANTKGFRNVSIEIFWAGQWVSYVDSYSNINVCNWLRRAR